MIVSSIDWIAIAPALIVVLTGIGVVAADLFLREASSRVLLVVASFVGVVVPAFLLVDRLWYGKPPIVAFEGSLVMDGLASFLSLAILSATALILVSADIDTRRRHIAFGEYFGLLLTSAAAMMLLVASNDFLMIFINLEILSLALYVLTGITRRNPRSNEAAMKYLVTGAFATGFLLLGITFVYGATGSFDLPDIARWIAGNEATPLLRVGYGLLLVGFGFKIGAVPFHMWVPDVYEGAPTTTTAFMSVTVKAAGIGALIRVLLVAAPHSEIWADILWWMAVATMVLGNLLAIQQTSVKRMLAFSSVAHTGYALLALATMRATDGTFSATGAAAALVYLLVYTFMTLGAFMVLVYVGHSVEVPGGHGPEWQDAEHIDDITGLGERHPWAAVAMSIFLVSLGGIPPTAGFFGKFTLFASAVERGHVVLAVIGVLASLVSLYYYLRVVVAMFMRDPVSVDEQTHPSVGLVLVLAAAATIFLGLQPSLFWEWATRSVELIVS